MKKKFLLYFIGGLFSICVSLLGTVYAEGNECSGGIKLNTDFPLVGNCIKLKKGGNGEVDPTTVLPVTIGSLMKIIMSVILVVCFIMIIIAGIKRASNSPREAKDLIKKVAVTVLLLGLSGVILKVINPLFFG